jgi:hypothetical protein
MIVQLWAFALLLRDVGAGRNASRWPGNRPYSACARLSTLRRVCSALPPNLFYQYLAYPFPIRDTSFRGGSLFLLSPVFFAVLWGVGAGYPRWSVWALVCTVMLVNMPILLVMGTGWPQFGPRYTLDSTVPLLLLTAMGARRWPIWLLALLTGISIVSYSIGTVMLGSTIAQ